MGFIDDKTDLFGEIAVVKGIQDNFPELNKAINSFNSVKSSDGNIITLLLDLLKNLIDSGAIKEQFGKILEKTDSFEEEIKSTIAKSIIDTYTRNFDFATPPGPILKTPLSNIDLKGTLKTDPNTEMGKFAYGKDETVDFTRFLHGVTQSGGGSWKGMLDFNMSGTDEIEISFGNSSSGGGFEGFVYDFLNSIRLLDLSQLLSTLLDTLFGSISSLSDVGKEWILDQLKMAETVNKIISTESLGENVVYDNSFFEFSPEQMNNIQGKADGLTNGVYLSDLGCGFGESFIDLDSFSKSFDTINSIQPSLVKEATTSFSKNLLKQSTVGVSEENRDNVEFNLIAEIFENLPSIIFGMVIKPETVMLFQMAESMVNGTGSGGGLPPSGLDLLTTSIIESPIDKFMEQMKEVVVCLIKKIYSLIVAFLFDKVKAEILKLAAILFAKILKDQLQNYQAILDTIRNLLEQVNNVFSLITGD